MALAPGRFDYAPINERPVIKWPGNARVAFWVAPNMEFFEYLPENRPTQPDIPHYARMDYGNRVGFWRMLDVLNKHKLRACCCLNLELLDHFPEIKDAMTRNAWRALKVAQESAEQLQMDSAERQDFRDTHGALCLRLANLQLRLPD